MKSAVLFSGGKDSVMALFYSINQGDDVQYLLSLESINKESYMFHVPNIHLTDLMSEALDIALIKTVTSGEKEKELNVLKIELANLKELDVEVIYIGALFSTYQKSRIEKLCEEVGLKAISPFWHKDPREYMEFVLSSGFKFIIVGVYAEGLDKSWLGKEIDKPAFNDLIKISEKTHIHLAFEGGEAETLVIDGPIFKKRIEIIDSKTYWHRDSGSFHVLDAKLVNK